MRFISTEHQALLDSGEVARIDAVMFDLPSPHGQVGFFAGIGSYEEGGVTYHGAGTLFEIAPISAAADGAAVGLRIRLNGDARNGLDASVLSEIETVAYQNRPVSVYKRYMTPGFREHIATILVYRGYLDKIEHDEAEGGEVYMEAVVESRSLDLGRSGYRMRTDADQRLIDADDGLLKDVGTVETKELRWSDFQWPPPKTKKKFLGIFG